MKNKIKELNETLLSLFKLVNDSNSIIYDDVEKMAKTIRNAKQEIELIENKFNEICSVKIEKKR